jgi:hypothetical protein
LAAVQNLIRVDVYTHSSCERTEPANRILNDACARFPVDLNIFDISRDAALEIAYGKDTPVVIIDGTERFRREVNEHELKIILQTICMKKNQERRRQKAE